MHRIRGTAAAVVRPGIFLFFLLTAATALDEARAGSTPPRERTVECAIHAGPCSIEFSGGRLALDISPRPVRAMRDLLFTVTLEGVEPEAPPVIDLGMPGMDMGPNRVELRPVQNGLYQGEGIIVRCPSGRRTWKATVTVPGTGKVGFVFDVIY